MNVQNRLVLIAFVFIIDLHFLACIKHLFGAVLGGILGEHTHGADRRTSKFPRAFKSVKYLRRVMNK